MWTMNHRARKLTAIFFLLTTLAPSLPVYSAEFNPNFLISDEELQNANSMTREDIQGFLDSHGGYIATYQAPDTDGTVRTVADMIARTAATYRINPKYLLVKLQKEQSLVTDPNPTQKELDWATGYGICDACSMDDPALQKHKGIGTQIDSAAGIMRWYFDHLFTESWIKRPNTPYQIDNVLVEPANLATAFLYTYTPHIQGNQNFWKLWQQWFDQVYPDGTLLKSKDNTTVYLIQDGKKRPFTTKTALVSRFNEKMIITVPESEIARYDTSAAISLPNYSILKADNNYYLLDNDRIRPFENESVVRRLGYNPDEIVDVDQADISAYIIGTPITAETKTPLGRVLQLKENNQLYYISDNVVHPISDEQIAKINFPNLKIEKGSVADIHGQALGTHILLKDGALIGVTGGNEIYVIEKGQKRHIPSEAVFNGLGYSWKNIVWVNELTGISYPTGQPLYLRTESKISIADSLATPTEKPKEENPTTKPVSPMIRTPDDKTTVEGKQFDTPVNTYLIADYASGSVLSGKNIDDVRPMASFAKVMSGYRLFVEGVKLYGSTTYNPKEHNGLYNTFRIAPGESIRNQDLLSSFLISSLNQPGHMLVDSVEKNATLFVKRMNQQAQDWNLANTKFTDPTGEDLGNVTTAREYLTLYIKATTNADVRQFLGTNRYDYNELVDKDKKPRHYDSHSNTLMAKPNLPFRIISSKTGYLDEAGAGVIMHIERSSDKKQFIVLVMGNPDYANRFVEPERLARLAVENF